MDAGEGGQYRVGLLHIAIVYSSSCILHPIISFSSLHRIDIVTVKNNSKLSHDFCYADNEVTYFFRRSVTNIFDESPKVSPSLPLPLSFSFTLMQYYTTSISTDDINKINALVYYDLFPCYLEEQVFLCYSLCKTYSTKFNEQLL